MSGDVICRLHEVLPLTLYVPTEKTAPIPFKWVDVMRQTLTKITSPAAHTVNEYWFGDSDVLLSQKSIGTTRFHILEDEVTRCTQVGDRLAYKKRMATKPFTIWSEEWSRLSKKRKREELATGEDAKTRLQDANRKIGFFLSS